MIYHTIPNPVYEQFMLGASIQELYYLVDKILQWWVLICHNNMLDPKFDCCSQ